jgi:hypothetical protein
MSATPIKYRKLPGHGLRNTGGSLISVTREWCRLWLGDDHLLLVTRQGYTETYKRFYFRDIQAVIIRKTNKAVMFNAIWAIATFIFALWALAVQNLPGRVTLWIIAGIFGLCLLVNLLGGPSCETQIKTAVQTEQLPAWHRLRTARKGLARLRPLLLQAQGEIPADELRARLEDRLRDQTQGPAAEPT